ncbi:hypothetical protein MG293_018900 [Ovis ammon polii]|uniref:UPAR/Ly6 domain-containing protein n=2 Tax=Ovis TaxID=9935 RepID=A0A835ZVD1_SHEEP|nr:hypothetical protein JEQ12_010498 [Ovis aries]KAI4531042.1 hypothetical protein MG293_018900 [Ovis ammon polii]KAI4552460.1 hypothetical protein MJT46_017111 [Ovis ammon polii x Ovis aries]
MLIQKRKSERKGYRHVSAIPAFALLPSDPRIRWRRASTDVSPALYAPSANWDVAWILKLLLTVGQGFTIVVLGVMLWRQRAQGAQHRNASFPQFKPEIQAYENIHLAHLSSQAPPQTPATTTALPCSLSPRILQLTLTQRPTKEQDAEEDAGGNRMRCYDCGGGPSGSCKETVTTCGEGERCGFLERKPQPDLAQTKLSGNPSVTLIHHHPACVAAHHCNQVETEVVGDVTYTTHRDCCVGDLCNGAVASTAAPMSIVAAAVTTLAWLLPGLWRG